MTEERKPNQQQQTLAFGIADGSARARRTQLAYAVRDLRLPPSRTSDAKLLALLVFDQTAEGLGAAWEASDDLAMGHALGPECGRSKFFHILRALTEAGILSVAKHWAEDGQFRRRYSVDWNGVCRLRGLPLPGSNSEIRNADWESATRTGNPQRGLGPPENGNSHTIGSGDDTPAIDGHPYPIGRGNPMPAMGQRVTANGTAAVSATEPPRPLVPKKARNLSCQSTNAITNAISPKNSKNSKNSKGAAGVQSAEPMAEAFAAIGAAVAEFAAPDVQKARLKRRIQAACGAAAPVADWVAGAAANLVVYHGVPVEDLDRILGDVDAMRAAGSLRHAGRFFHSKAKQLADSLGKPWPRPR